MTGDEHRSDGTSPSANPGRATIASIGAGKGPKRDARPAIRDAVRGGEANGDQLIPIAEYGRLIGTVGSTVRCSPPVVTAARIDRHVAANARSRRNVEVVVPYDDIARAATAQQRFNQAISTISDAEVGRATLCPGWSVGHVLTHVARNADSHIRRIDAALRGEVVDQYPGGYQARAAEIEVGANRSAADLIADVHDSGAALEAAWSHIPQAAWDNPTRDVGGRERPLHQLVGRRWQELEVHLIDLDIGPTYRDWPDDFVRMWLPRLRVHVGDVVDTVSGLDDREQLAWLYGRLSRPNLPTVPPWG